MQLFVRAKGVCLTITSNKGRTRLQRSDSAELLVLTKLPVVQPEKFITSPSCYSPWLTADPTVISRHHHHHHHVRASLQPGRKKQFCFLWDVFLLIFFVLFCITCSVRSESDTWQAEWDSAEVIKGTWDAVVSSDRLIKNKHVNTDRTVIDITRQFAAASVLFLFFLFSPLVLRLLLNIKEHTQTQTHTFHNTVSQICIFVCCCSFGISAVGVTGDA